MAGRLLRFYVPAALILWVWGMTPPARGAGWDYDLALYLWALGMNGTTTVRGVESDIDLSFGDILEDLEMAVAAHFEANKRESRWGWFSDLFYSSLGNNLERPRGEFDLNMAYVEAAGTYKAGRGFRLLAGVRYVTVDLELKFDPRFPLPPRVPARVEGDQSWADLMLGGQLKRDFGDCWRLWGRADLAGFGLTDGTDLTWNLALMGQVKVSRRVGLILGYRWFDIDYENQDDRFALDVRQAGPVLALNYSFH